MGRDVAVVEGGTGADRRAVGVAEVQQAADLADLGLDERPGWTQVRRGRGLKERPVPLSLEAHKALAAYLEVRPEWTGQL